MAYTDYSMKELIEYNWSEDTQDGELTYEHDGDENNLSTKIVAQPISKHIEPVTEDNYEEYRNDYWTDLQWYLRTQEPWL